MSAEWLDGAERKLRDRGLNLKETFRSANVGELCHHAEQAASEGRLVIVGGGDGTLSAVADRLRRTDAVMGVLPLGTGNAFARDLSIPTDLDQAIDVIAGGRRLAVDVGICDGRCFLNVVTIGLTATVARSLTVPLKRRFGRFVYAAAVLKALRNIHPFTAKIESDNGVTEIRAVQLVVGNGRFHGGPLPLTPEASIVDSVLKLYAVEAAGKWELLKFAALLPVGMQGSLRTVHSEECTRGTVSATPAQAVVIDGEIADKTPFHFAIEPGSLNVIVPEDFAR